MDPEIETAFQKITQIVLGRKLSNHAAYADWLRRGIRLPILSLSPISGKTVYSDVPAFFRLAAGRAVKMDEAPPLAEKKLPMQDLPKLFLSSAKKLLRSISYYSPEIYFGENIEVHESGQYAHSQHCFSGSSFLHSKYCSYAYWPFNSEYIFGSDIVFYSKFCLKCYNSTRLTRCLEVSHSSSSSDCYFCHIIEACSDCLFCFNVKSMRYAIGNVEYPKEEYMKVKKVLLQQLADQLENDKTTPHSIFSIGARD